MSAARYELQGAVVLLQRLALTQSREASVVSSESPLKEKDSDDTAFQHDLYRRDEMSLCLCKCTDVNQSGFRILRKGSFPHASEPY